MKKPTYISVVVPAHNEEKFIGPCLSSLNRQTITQPFEIIVVDNNSSDKTASIAREHGARVIKESMQSPGKSRNKGTLLARGEILVFIDADYTVSPSHLKTILAYFMQHPDVSAIAGAYCINDILPIIHTVSKGGFLFGLNFFIIKFLFGVQYFTGGNLAIRKDAYLSIGGYRNMPDVNHGDDIEFSARMAIFGYRSKFIRSITADTSGRRFKKYSISEQLSRLYWFFYHILSYRIPLLRFPSLPPLKN